MSKEKQIEEISNIIYTATDIGRGFSLILARRIYAQGYRKQSEGEWKAKTDYAGYGYYCSNCNAVFTGVNAEWIARERYYCSKCGAKMRGGDEW